MRKTDPELLRDIHEIKRRFGGTAVLTQDQAEADAKQTPQAGDDDSDQDDEGWEVFMTPDHNTTSD